MKSRSGFETKVLSAFAAAALVVSALTLATWNVAQDAAEAVRRVVHTQEVLNDLTRIRADSLQIELSTQNYRISGDPKWLADRDAAISARETLLRQLQLLTADNASQQARWARLRKVIDERLAISRHVELLRKTQGLEAASAYVAGAPLRETRERMYRQLDEMRDKENRLLEHRSAEQSHARQITVAAGTLVTLMLIALLSATYVLIRRQLRETEASQRALAMSEENLSTTLDSIGDAVLATDTEGRVTRMNPVAERLTGWPLAEARNRFVDEVFRIVNEETRVPAVVPVDRVLATGEIQGLANHTVLIARDGGERPVGDSAAPIRDAVGQVSGVVLVFRDMTIERQAQQSIREQNERLEQCVRERTAQLHDSEERFRLLVDSARDYAIIMLDPQGHVLIWNEGARRLKGYAEAEIIGQPIERFYPPEDAAADKPARLLAQAAAEGRCEDEGWRVRKDGTRFYADVILTPIRNPAGELVGFAKITRDITARKRTEEKIQTLNTELEQRVNELEHVSRALRTLSAGNRTMLHATDEQDLLDSMCSAIVNTGRYHMALVCFRNDNGSGSLRPMAETGYPGGLAALRMLKTSWSDERGRGALGTAIRTGKTSVVRNMLTDPDYAPWRPHLHGNASGVACPLRIDGEVIGALAIYAAQADAFGPDEVTLLTESADDLAFGVATLRARAEQQKTQAALHRLTYFDALTGLPNETQFVELLAAAIDSGKRLNQSFAVLQTNIERLREINDALGFSHGDQLLREFGARLRVAAPVSALIARLRGDEFAILLPDSSASAAVTLVRRLEDELARPFPIADIPLDVSARIGVALFPEHGSTPHDLFRHMDMALQQARKKGVRHAVFDPARDQDQQRRLTMAGELRRAIEGGDLLLYLQPKVEIATGRVCGAEGLVRWQHTGRGMIPPGEFIGLAEHTGLIKPLTEWVIEAALRLNHAWQRQGCALPIAVNLSARNLREEDLLEKIRRLQAGWGGAAGLLELEITESTLMDDAEFALSVLHRLRDEGIPLYIDDFGTGYSSLSYLQKLPVDYIKIDQSFICNMSSSKQSALIVRSTIDLAHDLGRKVVAEGIETQENWDQLAALGCGFAQGYFIARPMPAEAFQNWLEQFRPPVTTPPGKAGASS